MIYTKDGQATHGTSATGVVGTVLGGTALASVLSNNNGCGNGLLGGLFGGNNDCYEKKLADELSLTRMALATEKSERYADSVGTAVFKENLAISNRNDEKIQANYKELASFIVADDKANSNRFAQLEKEVALNKQAAEYNNYIARQYTDTKTDALRCYVDSHFVPGEIKLPLDSICPQAAPLCPQVQEVRIVEGSTIERTK